MMLTFEEHVKKFNLDEEEQEILAAYEAGKLKPDAESPKRIAELKKAAHETVKEIKARKAREATKMASFRLPTWVIEGLKRFNGHVIIQTMFLKGEPTPTLPKGGSQGSFDNTGEEYVGPWLEALKEIAPQQVMIYTIDRETPMHGLEKATPEELNCIRDRVLALGIPCTASY